MAVLDDNNRTSRAEASARMQIPTNLLVTVGVLLVLFVALNFSGMMLLKERWDSDANYGHGYLIPFISLYFVWAKKEELRGMTPRPSLVGLAVFLLAMAMTFLVMPLSSGVGSGLVMVVMANGLLLYLGGWQIYRMLWLPALYLIFMVPLPQGVHRMIALPLQHFASWVSAGILDHLFGIPTARDGNVIKLAGHTLQVAEACSGMRSIMGLLALGVAFAYFWQRPMWERIFLILSTVPIAIVANISRVTGTGLLYDWGYRKFAQGFYHEFTGWFVFIFAMTLFLTEAWVMSHLFVYGPAGGMGEATGAERQGVKA